MKLVRAHSTTVAVRPAPQSEAHIFEGTLKARPFVSLPALSNLRSAGIHRVRGRVVTLCLQLVELDSTEVLAVGYSSSTISYYCSTSHLEEQKEFPQWIQFLPEEAPREKL